MEAPQGPICQSCGMPLARDAQGGGTNRDGSRSTDYCSHCYREGAFTQPDLTVDEMQRNVAARLRSMSLSDAMVEKLTSGIPSLNRWQPGE